MAFRFYALKRGLPKTSVTEAGATQADWAVEIKVEAAGVSTGEMNRLVEEIRNFLMEKFYPMAPANLWTPDDLGVALAAWWSADDLADGAVASWADRVAALTLVQATGANQPVRAADSFNGFPGVTFDGINDEISVAATTGLPVGTTAGEIFSAWVPNLVSTAQHIFHYGDAGNNNSRVLRCTADGRAQVATGATATVRADGGPGHLAGEWFVQGGYWAGSLQGGRVDGRDFAPDATGAITLATGIVTTRMGADLTAVPSRLLNGVVRHVLVTTELTLAQRLQLEGWLAWDFNKPSVLHPSHPYAQFPPGV